MRYEDALLLMMMLRCHHNPVASSGGRGPARLVSTPRTQFKPSACDKDGYIVVKLGGKLRMSSAALPNSIPSPEAAYCVLRWMPETTSCTWARAAGRFFCWLERVASGRLW